MDIEEQNQVKLYKVSVDEYDMTYRLTKRILKIFGFRMTLQDSKRASVFWDALFWFNYTNIVIAAVLETANMFQMAASGTLFDLFTMMPCVGYCIGALSKAYKMKRYRHVFENLINEPRAMWPTGLLTEKEYKITSEASARITLFGKVYFFSNIVLACTFVIPSIITWVKSKTTSDVVPILPFFYWLPYDLQKGHRYEITFLVQTYQCFFAVSCMVIGDLLFCIFLDHITTQFALLSIRIDKLFYIPIDNQLIRSYPLGELSNDILVKNLTNRKEQEELNEEFSSIIKRHKALIRLSGDIESLYTFNLLINFMNSSIIICFCLFCCAFIEKWNEFIYKIFFVTTVMQIWMLCWYGQRLIDTSTGVGKSLYNCGWYMASRGLKKSILIMILRSQLGTYITTYGFSIISLENFANIMKTSWSYFTLLVNIYKG